MKILMTGASGLVGSAFTTAANGKGDTVCRMPRFSLPASAPGGSQTCSLLELRAAEAVVNLAGASVVGGRWTKQRKALLRSSRVETTRTLVEAMARMNPRPKVLISASATGYYGNRGDEMLTEESAAGNDFLASLAQEWEAEARKAEDLGIRVVCMRFGIILAKHGGALPKMMQPLKFGVGGKLGSGRQWISWITLADVIAILRWALENEEVRGAINVVSPNAVRNAELTSELARAMHRPAVLTVPAFALRLAMGEMSDALLGSQRVIPKRLEDLGYRFRNNDLPSALADLLE
ncbi:MAG: hypothetical protein NVS9B4_25460 [Candidatus Acidiferrum sp.]